MKILSKLDNTGMIEEVADKRYVTDAEKSTWNNKADETYVDSLINDVIYSFMTHVIGAGYDIGNDPTLEQILEMFTIVLGDYELGIAPSLGEIVEEMERNKITVSIQDLGTFNDETELITHVVTNQLSKGHYTFIMNSAPAFMLLEQGSDRYFGTYHDTVAVFYYFEVSFYGEIIELKIIDLRDLDDVRAYIDSQDALKADKTYVDSQDLLLVDFIHSQDALKADITYVDGKVQTDVPAGAKFTDTKTTINGKTGAIAKADIVALGIPAQDTVVDISGKADKTYVDNKVKTDVPLNAKFTDTVYSHPSTHPASMITGLPTSLPANGGNADTVGGFTVGANVPAGAKFTDTVYSHPTTAGNKHIPTGGASGQVLKYSASGTATWQADKDTITTINGKTGAIAKADIVALGIPAEDTVVDISGKADKTYVDNQDALKADKTEVTSLANKVPATKGLVTVANKNQHYPIIMNNTNAILGRHLTTVWDGSSFYTNQSLGVGVNALQNNTGVDSNGLGYQALRNNTGNYSNGFGYNSLFSNSGQYSNGLGYASLQGNTGGFSNGFGCEALKFNEGATSSGFGHQTLMWNTGESSNGFGTTSLENNTGNYSNGFGYNSLRNNKGEYNSAFGHNANNTYDSTITNLTNTTCLGANTLPNRSNQVVLGDSSVDTVKMGGTTRTPASSTATGVRGETCWDYNYFYICIATNTWKRIKLRDSQNELTKSDVGLSNVDNVKQMPISGGVLENYTEKLTTVSASSGSIDLSLGNVFVHTPSGNRTYSITNAVSGQAHSFTLIINMGSTVRTLTFHSSVKWQGEEIPDLSTANKTYILTFMTVDGGTNWLGMFGGEF